MHQAVGAWTRATRGCRWTWLAAAGLLLAAAGAPPLLPDPPSTRPDPRQVEAATGGSLSLSPLSRLSEAELQQRSAGSVATGDARSRDQRRSHYLELALQQMHRLERIEQRLDTQRLAAGALTAAALAAPRPEAGTSTGSIGGTGGGTGGTGGTGSAGNIGSDGAGPAAPGDAARWVEQLLEDCAGRWDRVLCGRAELGLQRLVLRFPRALPPALLERARAAASAAATPPAASEAAAPWSFRDTENQRAVLMARSLVAAVVAGSRDSAAATAWGDYAAAFLAAHDRDGWYEAESPGYMAVSITALLHLADLAPSVRVRDLARRELDLLLAAWAQQQVAGYPAGPRSRTYVQWALGDRTTPWRAWAWLIAGVGDAAHLAFADWPELALADYRAPDPAAALLRERRAQAPYEIRARRRIDRAGRTILDAALYAYATPDYILGVAQAVSGLRLGVSGGEEIVATLYPEGAGFAPLYLWSRTRNTPEGRWQSRSEQDLAVGARATVVAYLGAGEAPEAGHAYLAAPWSRPEVVGAARATVVSWCGDAYVALTTDGGWDVAPAAQRFPDYYGPGFAGAWVAVPRRQPAAIGLRAGRRAEDGDLAAWRRQAALARLRRAGRSLELTPGGRAPALSYLPGERATVGGAPLLSDVSDVSDVSGVPSGPGGPGGPGGEPPLLAPFLSSRERGTWELSFGGVRRRFAPLPR